MWKNRIEKIIKELKEYEKEDRVGKNYHAWRTEIYAGHISNKYLGIVEYVGKSDCIINPFIVKNKDNEKVYAGTVDFFSNANEEPFSWIK